MPGRRALRAGSHAQIRIPVRQEINRAKASTWPSKRNGIDLPQWKKLHFSFEKLKKQAAAPVCQNHARRTAQNGQQQALCQ